MGFSCPPLATAGSSAYRPRYRRFDAKGMMYVCTVDWLLAVFGSVRMPLTLAVLVSVVPAGAVLWTAIVTVSVASTARLPKAI